MTIIISHLSHNHVIQVSDRRVVWIRPGNKIERKDDDRNKAVNFCHRMAFGYTGLAELGPELRTDIWLTRVLANLPRQSIDAAANQIAREATDYFRTLRHIDPASKCHVFVGIGWAIPAGENDYFPLCLVISNFHDERGNLVKEAKEEFSIKVDFLNAKDPGAFNVTGRQLPRDLYFHLRREFRKCAQKQLSPITIIYIIAKTIRDMSARFDDVGANLMAVSIPKSTLSLESPFYLMGEPSENQHTFLYLPADKDSGIAYGPNYVCGGTALTDYMHISGEEEVEGFIKEMAMPPPIPALDFYGTIVLTHWAGSGQEGDSYKPAISDQYILKGYGVITDIPSWPPNKESPYYGCLVGIMVDDSVAKHIINDHRFYVLWHGEEKNIEPGSEWINGLGAWLASRGMPDKKIRTFLKNITGCSRKKIAEELNDLLRIPRDQNKA